jgi:hypothetical protein
MYRKLSAVFGLLVITLTVGAQDITFTNTLGFQGAYYFPNTEGFNESGFTPISFEVIEKANDTQRNLGSGWGGAEAEFYFIHQQTIPVLVGEGLMESNRLDLRFRTGLSPVTLTQDFQMTLTPIAFLQFFSGLQVGTGWSALGFNGLGLNTTGIPETNSFPGAVVESWIGATFQFDLGAVVPGEWNHILILATEKWNHRFFTGAGENEPWLWMADSGQNFNGWERTGTYFLGHQPPGDLIDTYGFLLEAQGYLFDLAELAPMNSATVGSNWGSDFTELVFGPLMNFSLGENQSLAVLLQLETFRRYTTTTTKDVNFQDRDYLETNSRFKRFAFIWNMEL